MFCPRCGRPVSPTANFCGGCGLPKSEIERMLQSTQPQPVEFQPPVVEETDIDELNSTISRLEDDLTGADPIENYTIDTTANTNTDTAQTDNFADRIRLAIENQYEPQAESEKTEEVQPAEETAYSTQSEYSRNAPKHPLYSQTNYTPPQPVKPVKQVQPVSQPESRQDDDVTTVDFVWMMLISLIPVIGILYVIYQAFVQNENKTKRSWARATLIVCIFAVLLGMMFTLGIIMTRFFFW